ncbi:hypothetical protein [Hankyongella ginsenosidimutans]|uniref:hypothetical protein n=1 Tax=Hankyongella ginsenosidimutans TaxID=1763828 RepID=UPI001CA3614A|nr:hypothetical protein [Hankyongella ginsenosidimutans]
MIEPGLIDTGFGDVVADGLRDRSSNGPYAKLVEAIVRGTRETYEGGKNSPPSVIADVVSHAVAARRPRTRYAAGKFAKLLIGMRTWLGDRMFDRIIMSQAG